MDNCQRKDCLTLTAGEGSVNLTLVYLCVDSFASLKKLILVYNKLCM